MCARFYGFIRKRYLLFNGAANRWHQRASNAFAISRFSLQMCVSLSFCRSLCLCAVQVFEGKFGALNFETFVCGEKRITNARLIAFTCSLQKRKCLLVCYSFIVIEQWIQRHIQGKTMHELHLLLLSEYVQAQIWQ